MRRVAFILLDPALLNLRVLREVVLTGVLSMVRELVDTCIPAAGATGSSTPVPTSSSPRSRPCTSSLTACCPPRLGRKLILRATLFPASTRALRRSTLKSPAGRFRRTVSAAAV